MFGTTDSPRDRSLATPRPGAGARLRGALARVAAAAAIAALAIVPAASPSAVPGADAGKRHRAERPASTLREEDAGAGAGARGGRGHGAGVKPQIIGGSPVPAGTYRFTTFLNITIGAYTYLCGGSLIDASHVLTAAHCVDGASAAGIKAWIGGNQMGDQGPLGAIQRSASAVQVHPSWNGNTTQYDAAVITLGQAVPPAASGGVDPIRLAGSGSGYGLGAGTPLTVAGWGVVNENTQSLASQLMAVSVPVQSDAYCENQYWGSSYSTAVNFCAGPQGGGKDSCQGDSGGPIFFYDGATYTQIGVVSWGYGCADAGYPGVYTRLANSSISNFVNGILGNPLPPAPPAPVDVAAPSVRITSPARNKLVRPSFTVNVAASDDTGIRGVELQQCFGSRCTKIATDNAAPFSFRITGPSGKAVIRAVATDLAGHTASSAKVPFYVR
ncbi:MAG: trypsin-like serine protease [Chloroflexota bacterium]